MIQKQTREILKDGFKYVKKGHPELAEKLFAEALRQEPTDRVKYVVAIAYLRFGNTHVSNDIMVGLDDEKARNLCRLHDIAKIREGFDPMGVLEGKTRKTEHARAQKTGKRRPKRVGFIPNTRFRIVLDEALGRLGMRKSELSTRMGYKKESTLSEYIGENSQPGRDFEERLYSLLAEIGVDEQTINQLRELQNRLKEAMKQGKLIDDRGVSGRIKAPKGFNKLLNQILDKVGISHFQLSHETGVGFSYLKDILNGKVYMSFNNKGRLMRALENLGVSKTDLDLINKRLNPNPELFRLND